MSERILVVDDSNELRTQLSEQLRRLGHHVRIGIDGEDALTKAREFKPSLVIMDISMPKMTGIQATVEMRRDENLQNVPIVLMSAFGEEQLVIDGIRAGADEYLVKPFRQDELAARVKILLTKSEKTSDALDETTVQGLEEAERDTTVMRFKETGQIVSKDFAGFQILDKLGQGGSATVYRALEPIHLKPVALKVISPFATAKPTFLKRLERSNKISVSVKHDRIVRTYTMGEYQDVHYMVQEFVEGPALDTYIKDEDLNPTEPDARRWMLHIAEALAYLDSQNLIHRDVKPGNIYLDAEGGAKLGDFGLSRLVDDVDQTAEGYLLGTPHYISPEQANGKKQLDIRSDIYSLGATFYHLLANQPLFEGETLREVVLAHLSRTPRPLHEVAPHISPDFCALIDRQLAKEVEQRAQTGAALVDEIRALP